MRSKQRLGVAGVVGTVVEVNVIDVCGGGGGCVRAGSACGILVDALDPFDTKLLKALR